MHIFLSVLIVIAALLLIGAVLIQKSKGGGLASNYASGNQYMGYRKTTDFIEKATWSLAIFICVCSICASFALKAPQHESAISNVQNSVKTSTEAPASEAKAPVAAPAAPAAQQAGSEAPQADNK